MKIKLLAKVILYSILIGSPIIANNAIAALSSGNSTAPILINSVTISRDPSSTSRSTSISLTNLGPKLSQWQLGFLYLQTPLLQFAPAINPNSVLQICDANNQCSQLTYLKAPNIKSPDLSAGYTTILAGSVPLLQGQTYTIQLLHINQGAPVNYANVPQNFFLINSNKEISHINTGPSTYHFTDYDQNAINKKIKQHIENNWNSSAAQQKITNPIVPAPVSYLVEKGIYKLNQAIVIHNLLEGSNAVASLFASSLTNDLGISAKIDNSNIDTGIIIKKITDPAVINNNPEGYQIQIQTDRIVINVLNDTGLFYAYQTLRQLWNQSATIQNATIIDYPRFRYRGLLLDTARHFFTPNEIKKLIDLMAAHKLNTLHIHFADDEGFRLDVLGAGFAGGTRGYGQLIGSMVFTQANLDSTNYQNKSYPYADDIYSHFYNASDIQQLIAYANANKITIIPEIDIPGHARGLIKGLPDSMIDPNDKSQFVSVQGYTDDVIPVCLYDPNSSSPNHFTTTINQVVQQIASLFTSQTTLYARDNEISVGADEVSQHAWSRDPECQDDWANLTALEKGQKFFQMMSNYNPTLLFSGWQQLVQTDGISLGNHIVPANQTAHIWVWNTADNGVAQAINLAQKNYPTVLTFANETYFDLTYTPDIREPGLTWATNFSDTHAALTAAISASAVIKDLSPSIQTNVVGIEGALWSEDLTTWEHLVYMALPKIAGLSEASWSPASVTVTDNNKVDWQSLAQRLGCGDTGFLAYLNKRYGVHYRGYPDGIKLELPAGVC